MTEAMTSAAAARVLGVSASTVKRWVNEGLLHCVTTPGGHRRFERSDVEQLRQALGGGRDDVSAQLLECILQNDDNYRLQSRMIELRGRLGSWWQVADLLGEALVELGSRWAQGSCSIAQEHAASECLRQALWACGAAMPSPPTVSKCLLAPVEGDAHTLGLSLAEICLREEGWACISLGGPTPTFALIEAIRKLTPSMVCMSASAASSDAECLDRHLKAIAEECRRCRAILVLGGDGTWPDNPSKAHRVRSFAEFAFFLRNHRLGKVP